ncbi:hypothetical protein E2542_SST13619 [Spatholobus suberectus]|nr:hypothetical protein E2542_SST13619 [Spatholobus suberectus]
MALGCGVRDKGYSGRLGVVAAFGVAGVASAVGRSSQQRGFPGTAHNHSFSVRALKGFRIRDGQKIESGQTQMWASGPFWFCGFLQNYMLSFLLKTHVLIVKRMPEKLVRGEERRREEKKVEYSKFSLFGSVEKEDFFTKKNGPHLKNYRRQYGWIGEEIIHNTMQLAKINLCGPCSKRPSSIYSAVMGVGS